LLNRGARLTELLKQSQYAPLPVEQQVVVIFAGVNGFLDKLDTKRVVEFETAFLQFMDTNHQKILNNIATKGVLSAEDEASLRTIIPEFVQTFA